MAKDKEKTEKTGADKEKTGALPQTPPGEGARAPYPGPTPAGASPLDPAAAAGSSGASAPEPVARGEAGSGPTPAETEGLVGGGERKDTSTSPTSLRHSRESGNLNPMDSRLRGNDEKEKSDSLPSGGASAPALDKGVQGPPAPDGGQGEARLKAEPPKMKTMAELARERRLAGWQEAALRRSSGWTPDRRTTEAEFEKALGLALSHRQGERTK